MSNIVKARHVHMIGIGGVGISALARLLLSEGKLVSGTEDNESPETLTALRDQGVRVSLDLHPKALPEADAYVYSDAWLTNHPEVLGEARARGVPVVSFYEAMGEFANKRKLIAVSGTHGKTTTTAMILDVLEASGLDPMGFVGSIRAKTKSNFQDGEGEYFVSEADEYMRHFLYYSPYLLIITNIDADHLDYYRDLADIQSAFAELAQKVPKDGFVVCDAKNSAVAPVIADLACTVVDYRRYFDPTLPLKVLPLNRINAAAVLAAAAALGTDPLISRKALTDFSGTWRRFEYRGKTARGADVYDDYAHHPAEIAATLRSIRDMFPKKKITIIFQPHLYSRTKEHFGAFVEALSEADDAVITDIFAAREPADPSINGKILADAVKNVSGNARFMSSFDAIVRYVSSGTTGDDLIVTMGAGNIYKVTEILSHS